MPSLGIRVSGNDVHTDHHMRFVQSCGRLKLAAINIQRLMQ